MLHALPWNTDIITGIAFIGNDQVAAANKKSDILIWNLAVPEGKTPDPVRRLVGHINEINRLLVTPDGETLISASNDHTVKYWDALSDQGEPGSVVLNDGFVPRGVVEKVDKVPDFGKFADRGVWISAISISPDGRRLAAADMLGQVVVYSLTSNR